MRKLLLCYSAFALLGVAAAAASPATPPVPGEGAACNQSEVGEVVSRNDRGLKMKVVIGCEVKKRFSIFGVGPELNGKNLKCEPRRKEVYFVRTADKARDYVPIGGAPDQKCCEGTKAELPIRNLEQVQQKCQ